MAGGGRVRGAGGAVWGSLGLGDPRTQKVETLALLAPARVLVWIWIWTPLSDISKWR